MSQSGMTNYTQMLSSSDPSERRESVEECMSVEISEEVVKQLCNMLGDDDKGVRDAVSTTLIFNGNPLIPKYLVPFVSSPDISVRNLAGEVLLRIGDPAVDDMTGYIELGDDDAKKFVIDILGLIGSSKPLDTIIQVLRTNTNENVILACLEAIGNIAESGSLPVLIEFYEASELYKPTIIEALGKLNSLESLEFMLDKYEKEDDLTKFSIIESLGAVGDERTFFFLLAELKKIKGPFIGPIIGSLQMLKEKHGLDIPFDESIKNAILYTLLESEPKYKRAAASLVSLFDDKDIMDALLRIYGQDAEIDDNIKPSFFRFSDVIYSKLSGLIRQKPANLKFLLWLLKDMMEFDSMESINRLSQLEKRNLCDSFSMSLDNPDEEVRKSSAELLFYTCPETALLFADTMIEDDNIWNRLKILELVENLREPKAEEVLRKLASDPEEMIRDRAEWILSQRGLTNFDNKPE